MKFKKYRVVPDSYAGFEVQHRTIWLPFWRPHACNTFSNLESAKEYIEIIKNPIIYSE